MANYGSENYTNFKGVNLRNTAFLRAELDGGFAGTVSVKPSPDTNRAWQFPDKSGTLPISGTFVVQLAAIGAGSWSGTSVTVSGIRAEDALVCSVQDPFNTVTTDRVQAFLAGATPANGGVYLTFMNPSATATIPNELIIAYCAAR